MRQFIPTDQFVGVALDHLHNYLVRRGWTQRNLERDTVVEFLSPETDAFPILVPRHRELVDYARMVRRSVEIIADYENRTPVDVLEQILSLCDVFKSRIATDRASGSIPLTDAIELIEGIQDLVIYSASSELRQDAYFPRKLKDAISIGDNSRFGQTDLGSFIATFYVPLPARQLPELFDEDANVPQTQPLERRTVVRLMRGLAYAVEASRHGDYHILVNHYEDGLNANMCETLKDIILSQDVAEVEFKVEMDPEWHIPDIPVIVSLPRRAATIVEQAARELRGAPEVRHVDVEGWVYQLHHEGPHGAGQDYQVRVIWDAPDGTYKVMVSLSAEEYELALEAHREDNRVAVSGDLQKIGRYWQLLGAENFRIVT